MVEINEKEGTKIGSNESLEPLKVWTEDRWIFIRRMAGDRFCQKLFYKVCTFVWMANGIKRGSGLQAYQDALIEEVFQLNDKMKFVIDEKEPTEVTTWDGKVNGYLSHYQFLAGQICILGPVAGLYGRDIEQYLMDLRGHLISERKLEYSVNSAKYVLRANVVTKYPERESKGSALTECSSTNYQQKVS